MTTTKELYLKRNEQLHIATSYRGANRKQVRLRAWNEAFRLSNKIAQVIAENSIAPEADKMLVGYNPDGSIKSLHILLTDDGVTRKYVRLNDWNMNDEKIEPMTRLQRYLYHEAKANTEALEIRHMVDTLSKALTPTAN